VIEKGDRSQEDLAVAHLSRGIAFRVKGMFDQSLPELDLAVSLNPKSANALVNRGMLHRLKHEFDLALADLDRAIELDAKTPSRSSSAGSPTARAASGRRRSPTLTSRLRCGLISPSAISAAGSP
jgi:tetratricopeptide (TPR) repeat protein